MQADLILVNGNILTMNPSQPRAEAVATKMNHILKVGNNSEITTLIGKNTKVFDLKGKTVVPGFIDTHIHLADFGRTLRWIDVKEIKSIKALQDRIREQVAKTRRGKWILGSGWNEDNFAEKRSLTRQDLNAVSPDNPVIFYHQLGRMCVTNSKGLELAGLSKKTVAINGGAIERNQETGEPTGVLQGSATDLIWNAVPASTKKEILEDVKKACKEIIKAGITSVHWIVTSLTELSIAQKLRMDGSLPLRIFIIVSANVFESYILKSLKSSENNVSKIGGVLIFADGYLASETAALSEPYIGDSTNRGKLLYTHKELAKLAGEIDKANLQVIIHAMGDHAVNAAIEALKTLPAEQSINKNRHRLEQAALLNKQLIKSIKKQGLIVSVQPKVAESEFSVWSATKHLGDKRARMLFPFRTLLEKGICVIGGSDAPMEPLSPLLGIQAATTRKHFPKQRLTAEDALRIYTINAAHATFEDDEKGSIEQGKLADFTVLSANAMSIPLERLDDIEVEMTIIDGKVAFEKSDSN